MLQYNLTLKVQEGEEEPIVYETYGKIDGMGNSVSPTIKALEYTSAFRRVMAKVLAKPGASLLLNEERDVFLSQIRVVDGMKLEGDQA